MSVLMSCALVWEGFRLQNFAGCCSNARGTVWGALRKELPGPNKMCIN